MTEKRPPKPIGRPSKTEAERKSRNLTFRSRGNLHKKLVDAAKSSGRSMSEEIENRLDQSFEQEDFHRRLIREAFGSYRLYKLFKAVAAAMNENGERECAMKEFTFPPSFDQFEIGPAWLYERGLYDSAVAVAAEELKRHRPQENLVTPEAIGRQWPELDADAIRKLLDLGNYIWATSDALIEKAITQRELNGARQLSHGEQSELKARLLGYLIKKFLDNTDGTNS